MNDRPRACILALDTSTPVLTAAVWRAGEIVERHTEAGRHTGALLPKVVAEVMSAAGCQPAEVGFVAVGAGPGPYTSLRAGMMFAAATGAALRRPVIGACSLDITARGAFTAADPIRTEAQREFAVIADARRREVYWARYDHTGTRLAGPQVTGREDFLAEAEVRGWEVIDTSPSAASLAQWVAEELTAGQGCLPPLAVVGADWAPPDADGAQVSVPQSLLSPAPLYLRRPDAVEPTPPPAANAGPEQVRS